MAMTTDARSAGPGKISIILPLFDRRNAGWSALASAIGQDYPRERYEVIAVAGREPGAGADDPAVAGMLARCDAVVRTDLDTGDVANEIRFFQAGYERSTGDVLFFIEGHTVLEKRCCAIIAAHLRGQPAAALAWAPRINRGDSRLGELVAMHNRSHERRAAERGVFSLGANSIITRRLFERLGGLDLRYLRHSETALYHRALDAGVVFGRIREPLATHYNDMSVTLWRQLVAKAGRAKFSYYSALLDRGHDLRSRVRHGVYLLANRAWAARLLRPLCQAGGRVFLSLATRTSGLSKALAYRMYVVALGCTDLSGFCQARIESPKS
jgi:GT2 family glycosyltransferase